MAELIQGTCLLMCPGKERRIEEKGLLHKFEIDENAKGGRKPKADPKKTIKCYTRSAAGLIMTDPNVLRPASVLLSTVKYLFTKIATRRDVDWVVAYDFIFDRLRSVRQDVTIQRIDESSTGIKLYESMVRFLVYSAQRLCEENSCKYDRHTNQLYLAECVTHLLKLYDTNPINKDCLAIDKRLKNLTLNNDRERMEALYILLNMGNSESLNRALNLPLYLRKSSDVELSTNISLACYSNNYVRVFALVERLRDPILVCAAMTNAPKLRRKAIEIMSTGYSCKLSTFPAYKLLELLSYKSISKVQEDCKLFGLVCIDENISFHKTNFKHDVQLVKIIALREKKYFVLDELFHKYNKRSF
ncbi:SAC3 domain-containing protein 1 isoform X2 [Megachile rotundata]|uniref:SAC3 domain-containing protein 1 isoform X2 n=1 Tax=Megachile rotundata TaxID=143995 RepID=UPI003FD42B00